MLVILKTLSVFVILCLSGIVGRKIRKHLHTHHRERDTIDMMMLMVGMLVTFTAIVLGLLITSVKADHDQAEQDFIDLSLRLTQLDICMRDYGQETARGQEALRTYTATLIANTWPNEPRPSVPPGDLLLDIPENGPSSKLANLLNEAYLSLRYLTPSDRAHAGVQEDCIHIWHRLMDARNAAIEDGRDRTNNVFDVIMLSWLMLIFVAFGVAGPPNLMPLVGIVLLAIALSLSVGVIIFLSHPLFHTFPSEPMRAALLSMTAAEH